MQNGRGNENTLQLFLLWISELYKSETQGRERKRKARDGHKSIDDGDNAIQCPRRRYKAHTTKEIEKERVQLLMLLTGSPAGSRGSVMREPSFRLHSRSHSDVPDEASLLVCRACHHHSFSLMASSGSAPHRSLPS